MDSAIRSALKQIGPLVQLVRKARRQKQLHERKGAIRRYLDQSPQRKLQIGTSINVLPGWFNVDIIPLYEGAYFMDATERFPFPDASFDYIFSEHMIEHVEYDQAQFMLAECYRVMKPGGRIRISTPDLQVLANLYATEKTPEQQRYLDHFYSLWFPSVEKRSVGLVVNQLFDFEHKFLYDEETLTACLESAGFQSVTRQAPGTSSEAALTGIDAHANDYIAFETFVLEAVRR